MEKCKRDYNWRKHHQNKHIIRRILKIEMHGMGWGYWNMFDTNDIEVTKNLSWVHLIGTYIEYKFRTKHKRTYNRYDNINRYRVRRVKHKIQTKKEINEEYNYLL